jgi:hypothetical protein
MSGRRCGCTAGTAFLLNPHAAGGRLSGEPGESYSVVATTKTCVGHSEIQGLEEKGWRKILPRMRPSNRGSLAGEQLASFGFCSSQSVSGLLQLLEYMALGGTEWRVENKLSCSMHGVGPVRDCPKRAFHEVVVGAEMAIAGDDTKHICSGGKQPDGEWLWSRVSRLFILSSTDSIQANIMS